MPITLQTDVNQFLDSLSEQAEAAVLIGLTPLAHFHRVQSLLPTLEAEHRAAVAAVKEAEKAIPAAERKVAEMEKAYAKAEKEHGPALEKAHPNIDFWQEDQKPYAYRLARLMLGVAGENLKDAQWELKLAQDKAQEAAALVAHVGSLIDRLRAVPQPRVPAWWPA